MGETECKKCDELNVNHCRNWT